jgi:hypothetical protein
VKVRSRLASTLEGAADVRLQKTMRAFKKAMKKLHKPEKHEAPHEVAEAEDESRYILPDEKYAHITLNDGKKFFMLVKGEKAMLGGRVLIGTKVDDEGTEIGGNEKTDVLHVIDVNAIKSRKPVYWHLKYGTLHIGPPPKKYGK